MRSLHTVRLALAQLNLAVGDIQGNTEKIIENIARARELGADIVAFPELAVTGYPPEDLLLKQGFVEANLDAIDRIAAATDGITAIVGFVDVDKDIYNAAGVLHNGRMVGVQHKFFLPNYGVFDENRYFQAGTKTQVYTLENIPFGVEVCEDAWYAAGPHSLQAFIGGAELIIDINASPFHAGKWRYRERMLGTRASDNTCAIAYVNAVGAQDELVFDGQSVVIDPSGDVIFRCKAFEEQLAIVEIDLSLVGHQRLVDPRRRKLRLENADAVEVPQIKLEHIAASPKDACLSESSNPPAELEEIYAALVIGTRDYVNKNGFKEVVLGMSGGIDSALTACIACDALGADRVRVLIMPSVYSSSETQSDAEVISKNLGISYDYVPISDVFEAYKNSLAEVFQGTEPGVAEENLQARIRGNFLMAISNKFGSLVLTTGNKSETACGYSTLYGDMAGGFAVIKDVPKTLVYRLSNYRNSISPMIPESIITRPPSAELRPDQKDQDTLPPYEILDPIIEAYVEEDRSVREIVALGFDEATVRRVTRLIDLSEYKRRQAAPGVKITPKAFGRDRRLPITNKFRDNA